MVTRFFSPSKVSCQHSLSWISSNVFNKLIEFVISSCDLFLYFIKLAKHQAHAQGMLLLVWSSFTCTWMQSISEVFSIVLISCWPSQARLANDHKAFSTVSVFLLCNILSKCSNSRWFDSKYLNIISDLPLVKLIKIHDVWCVRSSFSSLVIKFHTVSNIPLSIIILLIFEQPVLVTSLT